MAGYTGGGGGGGASVVPASQVVASDREDESLDQAGLVAAIAALPAGGGDIYTGAGTLAITSTVTIDRDIKIFGAGIGNTTFTVAAGVTAFDLGAFSLTLTDILFTGSTPTGSKLLNVTAGSDSIIFMDRVQVGTGGLNGLEVIIDANANSRNYKISNCRFYVVTSGTGWFYQDGASGNMELSNVTATVKAAISSGPNVFMSTCTFSGGAATTFALSSRLSTCQLNADTLTFGAQCEISNCLISASNPILVGANCNISNCTFSTGGISANGGMIRITCSSLVSFTSASAGFDKHVLIGNIFTGAGNNLTLTDSDSCVVQGNVDCQVNETASSDSNRYSEISTASTLVGASSVVTDADRYAWNFPGTLVTTANAEMARPSPQVSTMIRLLQVNVVTAPTGADITVAFKRGTKSTGVVGATIGTVTVAINAFTGALAVSPAAVLASTEFIVAEITQVGSTIAGANATMTARA